MIEHGDTPQEPKGDSELDEATGLPEDVTATEKPASQTQAKLAAGEDSQPIEEIAEGGEELLDPRLPDELTPKSSMLIETMEGSKPPGAKFIYFDFGERRKIDETPDDSQEDKGSPENEGHSEAKQGEGGFQIKPGDIVVERQLIDQLSVTAVLTPLDVERASEVAAALEDCEMVVLCTDYYTDEAARAEQERSYNRILSEEETDENSVDQIRLRMAKYQYMDAAVVAQLQDSGKIVRLPLQMAEDQSEVFLKAYAAQVDCPKILMSAPPVEEARQLLYSYAQAQVDAIKMEEAALSRNLRTIIDMAGGLPDASVGIVLPPERFGFVAALSGEPPGEDSLSLAEKAERALSPIRRPVLPLLKGDIEQTVQSIDRSLLDLYAGTGAMQCGVDLTLMTSYIEGPSIADVEQKLCDLEPRLTETMPWRLKVEALREFISPIIEDMRAQDLL